MLIPARARYRGVFLDTISLINTEADLRGQPLWII